MRQNSPVISHYAVVEDIHDQYVVLCENQLSGLHQPNLVCIFGIIFIRYRIPCTCNLPTCDKHTDTDIPVHRIMIFHKRIKQTNQTVMRAGSWLKKRCSYINKLISILSSFFLTQGVHSAEHNPKG